MPNNCRGGIRNNKGIVLFFVLMLIFMETVFAGIVLAIIRSNDRQTSYKINRIRAHYAVNAAIVYTRARLYTYTWTASTTYAICRSAATCGGVPVARRFIDYEIPYRVNIVVSAPGTGPLGSRRVTFTTVYTPPL